MAGVAAAVVGVSSAGQSVSTTPGRDKGGGGTPGERGGGGRGEKGERESGSGVASRLDSIMVAYLRHQHRQCPAPIATCPPFSLLEPHACKEPGLERNAPANVARRVAAREICVPGAHGGPHGQRLMKQVRNTYCRDTLELGSLDLSTARHLRVGLGLGQGKGKAERRAPLRKTMSRHQLQGGIRRVRYA
jgi:hypothetical protein